MSSLTNYFFFSLLYNKFLGKIFYNGSKQKIEELLINVVFTLSALKIFKKPFFFTFFHLFENLSVNFALVSKRRGRRIYFIPVPVNFRFRYKQGLKICRSALLNKLNNWKTSKKINKFVFFFFFSYILKKKNYATTQLRIFKKKVKQNRIFAHWRWK